MLGEFLLKDYLIYEGDGIIRTLSRYCWSCNQHISLKNWTMNQKSGKNGCDFCKGKVLTKNP